MIFFSQISPDEVARGLQTHGSSYILIIAVFGLVACCGWLGKSLMNEKDKQIETERKYGEMLKKLEEEHGDEIKALLKDQIGVLSSIKTSIDNFEAFIQKQIKLPPHL